MFVVANELFQWLENNYFLWSFLQIQDKSSVRYIVNCSDSMTFDQFTLS